MDSEIECFHSFEVGFGPKGSVLRQPYAPSFHSFEVGFGLKALPVEVRVLIRFHSFEVGFGLLRQSYAPNRGRRVFIPSR